RAVVEFDALAQVEAPHAGRGLLPARGQQRGQAQVLVAAGQRLVDVGGGGQLQRLVERMRVHRQRVALVGDADGLRAREQARRRQGGQDGRCGHFFLEAHGSTPRVVAVQFTDSGGRGRGGLGLPAAGGGRIGWLAALV